MHLNTIHGGRDWTVSAILIRTRTQEEPEILLHRHRRLQRVLQPGGHVERNENPLTALAREIKEEAGYNISQLSILQPPIRLMTLDCNVVQPTPFSIAEHRIGSDHHFHVDHTYALITHGEPEHDVSETESQELLWVPLSKVDAIAQVDVAQLAQYACDVCLHTWEPIPLDRFGAITQVGRP